ncbi:MAG: methyltransferase domain-containing protein [Planctomycetota bacterium]
MSTDKKSVRGYLHGFTDTERERLRKQARFMEQRVHEGLPFARSRNMIEVGCGVGAQTEILLRRYPDLRVTGVDANEANLGSAREYLETLPVAAGRFDLALMDAAELEYKGGTFDAAFLCWILEHVADPARILGEVRRVLTAGAHVAVTEVQNMTFFLDPYSPNTVAYWLAFNEHQIELGGDPFVGAKLGNLLQAVGFREIRTEIKNMHLDNRTPVERAEMIEFWSELLLSGADGLLAAGRVSAETVQGMKQELRNVSRDPNAVFYYSFVRATARAW